jgi:hypothetical protein
VLSQICTNLIMCFMEEDHDKQSNRNNANYCKKFIHFFQNFLASSCSHPIFALVLILSIRLWQIKRTPKIKTKKKLELCRTHKNENINKKTCNLYASSWMAYILLYHLIIFLFYYINTLNA